MTLFSYLIVGHLIGDYLLQTNYMAIGKTEKWAPLLVHCVVYTSVVSIAFLIGMGTVPIGMIIITFVSHVFLDRRRFVAWWARTVMGLKDGNPAWLLIMIDQVFHVLVLAYLAHVWG